MKNKLNIGKIMKIGSIAIIIAAIAGTFLAQSCSSSKYTLEDNKMSKINESAQYNDGKFYNSEKTPGFKFGKMMSAMWHFIFADNDRAPDFQLPKTDVDFDQIKNAKPDELKVTWVGHSSQIINIDGKIILTDPMYENRTAFMGPSRYNGDIPFNINDLPEIDIVLLSHNHYDHLNVGTLEKIHNKVKLFVVPLMVGAELENLGVPREKIIELDWWNETLIDEFTIALTPAQHFSGRSIFDRDETLWGSFVVIGPHHKIFFSGDSGYFDGFKKIGEKYGPFDYTFMECGAYDERWHHVHMFPEESVQAHIDLKGKIMQPIHWGTFNLALHAWYDPMIRAAKTADSLGVKLSTPIIGETIIISDSLKTERWWEKFISKN